MAPLEYQAERQSLKENKTGKDWFQDCCKVIIIYMVIIVCVNIVVYQGEN